MRSIFEPLGWAVRKLDKDNGIDFDIEVFENFKSAGIFFKVQLKAQEEPGIPIPKSSFHSSLRLPTLNTFAVKSGYLLS
jgi:hypothetical protein